MGDSNLVFIPRATAKKKHPGKIGGKKAAARKHKLTNKPTENSFADKKKQNILIISVVVVYGRLSSSQLYV